MNKNFVSSMYVLNIVAQAIFSIAMPTALAAAVSWLSVAKLSAPGWIYAVLVPLGAIGGIVSAVKFVITACNNLERLENQRNSK